MGGGWIIVGIAVGSCPHMMIVPASELLVSETTRKEVKTSKHVSAAPLFRRPALCDQYGDIL